MKTPTGAANPTRYTTDFEIGITPGSEITLYFGTVDPGSVSDGGLLQFSKGGVFMLVLATFAYEDDNGDGDYDIGIDVTPYGQALPFQGVCSNEPGNVECN